MCGQEDDKMLNSAVISLDFHRRRALRSLGAYFGLPENSMAEDILKRWINGQSISDPVPPDSADEEPVSSLLAQALTKLAELQRVAIELSDVLRTVAERMQQPHSSVPPTLKR